VELSIIIPVYNKIEIIGHCIALNIKHCSQPQEWIIIDNASENETKIGLQNIQKTAVGLGHSFIIIDEEINTGVAIAWNKGLSLATQENICILNNDCVLMPDWDKITVQEINRGKLDVFAPFVLESPMFKNNYSLNDFLTGRKNWSYYLRKNKSIYRYGFFGGVVLLGKHEIFKEIMFDEAYWLSMEDIDFEYRCMQSKLKVGITGKIIAYHHVSATRKNMLVNEEKNQLIFEKKFGWNFSRTENKWTNKMIRSINKRLFLYFDIIPFFRFNHY
jgi:GT2 family glycosyltransferase